MLVAEDAQDTVQEMLGVVVGVEPDQVRPQETLQDLPAPRLGQQAENLERGEGDVQEEPDRGRGLLLPQQLGEQHEVVVVNPDHVVGLHERRHGLTENAVDAPVMGVETLLAGDVGGEVVKQGPDSLVTEPVIELVHGAVREEHGMRVQAGELLGHQGLPGGIGDGHSRPADPLGLGLCKRRAPERIQVGADAGNQSPGALAEQQLPLLLDRHDGQSV